MVETIFTARVKRILETKSLFDFSKWGMVYFLLDSFDPEYTKVYLEKALTSDENVLRFLARFVTTWTGSGTEYEIQEGYSDHFTAERVLEAIEVCRKDGTLFRFPQDLQHKCAAFFLANSGDPQYNGGVYQNDTEKILASWKAQ